MKIRYAFRNWAPALALGAAAFSPIVCVTANGQASQATIQPLLEKAHTLEVRGRLDLAAQTWQQVLLTDPNNTEALGGMARAAKATGDVKTAGNYIDRLRAINPNDPGIARAERMETQADHNTQLASAGKLAKQGQYAQAMNVYRQVFGNEPPPGDSALAYYETESATSDGRPHAIAGLRSLAAQFPGDSRYQVALGRILTYEPKTRVEGRRLLEAHPGDPQAVEALKQSLLWDAQNPATATDIRAYLQRHPDAQLAGILENEPKAGARGGRTTPLTESERASAAAYSSRSAEDRDAYRSLNAKRLEEAETKFKAILQKTPEDSNALAGIGYIRMQQANFGGAISFLVQAKQDGSHDPGVEAALMTARFWYTMGEGSLALTQENLPEAEKQYRVALQMRPTSVEALEGLGGTLLKEQQPDAAIPIFEQYVKLKPSAPHAWRGLMLAHFSRGDAARAIEVDRRVPPATRAVLATDPLYLQTLAASYTKAGRDDDAQRVLKGALDLPFPADAHGVETDTKNQYAGLLQAANHYDQAAGLYRQVLAKEPENIAANQGLVRVLHAAGQDEPAIQAIEGMSPEVYAKAMHDSGFDDTVASIYQGQHRLDVAQDILEKSLQWQVSEGAKPSVAAQVQLAGIYLERANPQQAYPLYQQILTQHPDRLDAWKGLLNALHSTGRDQEALAQVQQMPPKVRADLESDVDFLQTVAGVYAALGQPQESQIFLRRVQAHYAALHTAPPADVDIQSAWLLYNAMNDAGLYRQLMQLGGRTDLTDPQRRTVQTIWTNLAVRRANQAAAAGNDRRALAILNATAHTFPDNPEVIKALAGGYARAGMPKQAVAIWKSMDMQQANAGDYKSAVGAALAANDQKDAEVWLRFGLAQYPQDAQVLLLAAKFEQQRGDVNRAAEYYKASLKAMPESDPGAALASELSHATPAADLPGGLRFNGDLAKLLAPGSDPAAAQAMQPMAPAQPYLPGGADSSLTPVPMGGDPSSYAPQLGPAMPDSTGNPAAAPQTRPAGKTRLRDYVPQAYVPQASVPHVSAPQASLHDSFAAEAASHAAASSPLEESPVLSPALYQHRQIVRLTEQALRAAAPLTMQPVRSFADGLSAVSLSPAGLSQGATFRAAAFHPQQATKQPNQSSQPLTSQPAPSNGTVYGAFVPYTPPGSKPKQQPQVPQPGTSKPLTTQPTGKPVVQTAAPTKGVVYGTFVPYKPPPATSVQLGNNPPTRQIKQPEVTDVLPTAKYGTHTRVNAATRNDTASAAAARRRAAAAAAATGQSKPPAEDYATPPTEPAQYTPSAQQPPTQYLPYNPQKSGGQVVNSQTAPANDAPPQQTGDSYGQQYPQPRTGATPVARRRTRAHAHPTAPAPAPVADRAPSLSYPGVGSPLGYQPYPVIGPAYPLPSAPTDQDLIDRRLPPLRGAYYTGPVLASNVPLTERQQAERDLASLEASYSGWLGGTGSARYRSGVVGYDRLTDLEVTAEASFVADNKVRFSVLPKAVFLNSGTLNLGNFTGVANSPVLGTLNTATAAAVPSQQFANGVGGEIEATGRNFAVAVGYTPYEFLVRNITGRALFKPNNHFSVFFNRDSVNETQLSYAGLRDPGSANAVFGGNIWGGVVQTVGGVRFDAGDERAGFYITGDGGTLNGFHTLDNTKFEGSMGAYFLAHTFPGYGKLNIGVSLFGMHYAQNERPLSYGLGGYFSPEAYLLGSVPITFTGRYGTNFHYTIAGSAGVQTFQEASQSYFPLDRGTQTGYQNLGNCTAIQIANGTCGVYPINSNTGGNYNFNAEGAYRVAEHWFAGGYISANNTNNYNTVTGGFFVRYLFRPQIGTEDYPTGLFPVEGFRPLRVP